MDGTKGVNEADEALAGRLMIKFRRVLKVIEAEFGEGLLTRSASPIPPV